MLSVPHHTHTQIMVNREGRRKLQVMDVSGIDGNACFTDVHLYSDLPKICILDMYSFHTSGSFQ